jgi:hypothetical protein
MKTGFLKEKNNKYILLSALGFIAVYFVPFRAGQIQTALQEAFIMLSDYAREHVLFCLIPAFFIAGAIMIFLNQQAVIKYFGPNARKITAYSVASVSGSVLAVCSCTVLPIFKGIYKKGAGIGPAVSFLYSGPAINILAIILTAKVLGIRLGIARALLSILFAFIIGIVMQLLFRKEDERRTTNAAMFSSGDQNTASHTFKPFVLIASLAGILVFLNWTSSGASSVLWDTVYRARFYISGIFGLVLIFSLIKWFRRDEMKSWLASSRDFAVQILPLLAAGVLIAGFLFGRPGHTALIPETVIARLVGSNSIGANLIASVSGAFMYFATLTEVPILQGLMGAGMSDGPALALLLAGPSLSLPSMLVISSELGIKKTLVYILLVVFFSSLAGFAFGSIAFI